MEQKKNNSEMQLLLWFPKSHVHTLPKGQQLMPLPADLTNTKKKRSTLKLKQYLWEKEIDVDKYK